MAIPAIPKFRISFVTHDFWVSTAYRWLATATRLATARHLHRSGEVEIGLRSSGHHGIEVRKICGFLNTNLWYPAW